MKNPDILLCDEPTGALDYNTSKEILKLIENVNVKYGNTVIMVTHNLGVASYVSNKLMVMKGGHVVEYGKREDVIRNPQDDYTKQLLRAVPVIGGKTYYEQ